VTFRFWRHASLLLAVWLFALAAPSRCAAAPQFDDPPQPFQPRHAPSEVEQDRTQALACFSMARDALGSGDYTEAISYFQRTLRYDPASQPAAASIVRLAVELRRPDAGVFAAGRLPHPDDLDRLALRRLAMLLSERGRWEEAVDLYEVGLGARPWQIRGRIEVTILLTMARVCHLVEEHENAADYFAEFLKVIEEPKKHNLAPSHVKSLLDEEGALYQQIGLCFLAAGRLDEAEAAFDKSQQAAPDPGRGILNEIRLHQRAGRLAEALEQLGLHLDDSEAEHSLGVYQLFEELLQESGRGDELLDTLMRLHGEQPDNTTLAYFFAQKLFDAERFDDALPLYDALVEQSPTSTAYRRLLAIHAKCADYDKAAEVLAALVKKTGTLDAVADTLQPVLDSESAMDALLQIGAEPSQDDAHLKLATGLLALAAERFEAAEQLLEAALGELPDNAESVMLTWGADLLAADRYADAARVLQQAAAGEGVGDRQLAVYNYYLAAALEMDDQHEAALEAARQAAEQDPDSAAFHSRVAWVLYHSDRKPEAAVAYRAIIDRFDGEFDSPQTRSTVRQARMVLSTLCLPEGRTDEAVQWLEQVLDEFPEDAGALNDLGYLWADENQHLDRAHRMIQKAVEAEPDNAAYRDSLGWVLYRRGQFAEAVVELEKAAGTEPDPVVLDHLGDAYDKNDQADKASDAWRRAIETFETDGQDDEAAEVREKLVDG
jgi:tetratricopeptide (TPR) repeat protein